MPSNDEMKAAMRAYVERINAGDLEGVMALYAGDATVEDPVGVGICRGTADIRTFYEQAFTRNVKLRIVGPQRGSAGAFAAMPLDVEVDLPGAPKMLVGVIETMRFNEAGKVVEMRAYWGSEDMSISVE